MLLRQPAFSRCRTEWLVNLQRAKVRASQGPAGHLQLLLLREYETFRPRPRQMLFHHRVRHNREKRASMCWFRNRCRDGTVSQPFDDLEVASNSPTAISRWVIPPQVERVGEFTTSASSRSALA